LNSATSEQLWSTFTHLKADFVDVCQDVFGNYVAQKYLELGSDELRREVVETLKPYITSLSLGTYGCRVVQKLLECVSWEQKQVVVQQFTGSIIEFVFDKNGNHVVQMLIRCLGVREIGFIEEEIVGHTLSLAIHPYGSRVIQRLLEKVSRIEAQLLLSEIKQQTVALSKNQYGNYIIQWIIKHCAMERRDIVQKLKGRVAKLSRDKYASNVVEQVFKWSSQAIIRDMADELFQDFSAGEGTYPVLAAIVCDQFGNYVIQTLLESSTGALRHRLLASLSKCGKLDKFFGKNLSVKCRQLLRKMELLK